MLVTEKKSKTNKKDKQKKFKHSIKMTKESNRSLDFFF